MEIRDGQNERDLYRKGNDAPLSLQISKLSEKDGSLPFVATKTFKEKNLREKVKHITSNITVEPLLIGYTVPYILSSITTLNLNLEKACRVNLNYSDIICTAIAARETGNYTIETTAASTITAQVNTWASALEGTGTAILVLFAGSWSDRRHRRQPLAVSPIIGDLCTNVGLFLCAIFLLQWPLEVAGFIEAIFPAITGGIPFMSVACFAFIGEVTSVEDRTFRIGMFSFFSSLASPVATALSGYLHDALGYLGVYSLVSFLDILVLMYAVFRFKEPTPPVPRPPEVSCLADFFDWRHVKNTVSVALRDGPGNRRLRVFFLIVLHISIEGPIFGEYANLFLYTLNKFQWSSKDFAFYATYDIIVTLAGNVIVSVFLIRLMKLQDCYIGIVGIACKIFSIPIFAFGNASWHMYAGKIVTIVSSGAGISMSSLATKMVGPAELGQLMGFLAIVEAFIPAVFNPLYGSIFSHTLASFPGAFYLASAVPLSTALISFLVIDKLQKHANEEEKETKEKKQMKEEKETKEKKQMKEEKEGRSLGVTNLSFSGENEEAPITYL